MMKKTEIIQNVANYMFEIISNGFYVDENNEIDMEYFDDDVENLKLFLNEINKILKTIDENKIHHFKILNFGCDDWYTLFIYGKNNELLKTITWDFEYNLHDLCDVECEYTVNEFDVGCNGCPRKILFDDLGV